MGGSPDTSAADDAAAAQQKQLDKLNQQKDVEDAKTEQQRIKGLQAKFGAGLTMPTKQNGLLGG